MSLNVLAFVQEGGAFRAHSSGSLSLYLHAVMKLAYNLCLSEIEVCTLVDAQIGEKGIISQRRKNPLDNFTCWNVDLRQAVE